MPFQPSKKLSRKIRFRKRSKVFIKVWKIILGKFFKITNKACLKIINFRCEFLPNKSACPTAVNLLNMGSKRKSLEPEDVFFLLKAKKVRGWIGFDVYQFDKHLCPLLCSNFAIKGLKTFRALDSYKILCGFLFSLTVHQVFS